MHLPNSAPDIREQAAWAQPGITDVAAARAFLQVLRRRDVLFYHSGDTEPETKISWFNARSRGLGITLTSRIVAASEPPQELRDYHNSLGLGPHQIWVPKGAHSIPLVDACLADDAMLSKLHADTDLRALSFRYRDTRTDALAARLGLPMAGCAPAPGAYAALNDKARLAAAGRKHGFETLPSSLVSSLEELDAAFEELHRRYGAGCMLRERHGAGGSGLAHARTLSTARRLFRRMARGGELLITPFIPPSEVIRNLSLHGIVTPEGFAPLVLTDQILRGWQYRGSRCAVDLTAEEIQAVRASLPGLGRWLVAEGYVDAPAGVDGFLLKNETGAGLQFVVIDPNIRLTNTMRPWSAVAALSEAAHTPFLWDYEWATFCGTGIDLPRLRQRLGHDLLDAAQVGCGGILPGYIGTHGWGPFGITRMEILVLARDAAQMAHLRRKVADIGLRLS